MQRLAVHRPPGVSLPWTRRCREVCLLRRINVKQGVLGAASPVETGFRPPRPLSFASDCEAASQGVVQPCDDADHGGIDHPKEQPQREHGDGKRE